MPSAAEHGWIEKLGIFEVLFDEGYRRLRPGEPARVGDYVLYYKDGQLTHIGLVVEVNPDGTVKKVQSKWGAAGEFIHDPGSVPPVYGTPPVVTNR